MDGLSLRAPRATVYLPRVAAKLKHEDLLLKKIQMPNKFFLGSMSLVPIKPRRQKAATEPSLWGHPSQSR